jgi:hypothetical protein
MYWDLASKTVIVHTPSTFPFRTILVSETSQRSLRLPKPPLARNILWWQRWDLIKTASGPVKPTHTQSWPSKQGYIIDLKAAVSLSEAWTSLCLLPKNIVARQSGSKSTEICLLQRLSSTFLVSIVDILTVNNTGRRTIIFKAVRPQGLCEALQYFVLQKDTKAVQLRRVSYWSVLISNAFSNNF